MTPPGGLQVAGPLIGKGSYSKVHLITIGGKPSYARKEAKSKNRDEYHDYKTEHSVFKVGMQMKQAWNFKLLPNLHDCSYHQKKNGAQGSFTMELMTMTLEQWFNGNSHESQDDRNISRYIVHMLARLAVLDAIGVSHNDLFLRNVMIRTDKKFTIYNENTRLSQITKTKKDKLTL